MRIYKRRIRKVKQVDRKKIYTRVLMRWNLCIHSLTHSHTHVICMHEQTHRRTKITLHIFNVIWLLSYLVSASSINTFSFFYSLLLSEKTNEHHNDKIKGKRASCKDRSLIFFPSTTHRNVIFRVKMRKWFQSVWVFGAKVKTLRQHQLWPLIFFDNLFFDDGKIPLCWVPAHTHVHAHHKRDFKLVNLVMCSCVCLCKCSVVMKYLFVCFLVRHPDECVCVCDIPAYMYSISMKNSNRMPKMGGENDSQKILFNFDHIVAIILLHMVTDSLFLSVEICKTNFFFNGNMIYPRMCANEWNNKLKIGNWFAILSGS